MKDATKMTRRHLLILIALLTVGTVAAQNSKKMMVEKGPELEKMKAIYNFLYKDFFSISGSTPSVSVENEPLPWMNKSERVPSTRDLYYNLDEVRMIPKDSIEDSPDICITGAYRSGMGVEGMIDKTSYPVMTACETADGKQTHLISKPIASLGDLRIELISHLYDKTKRPIGFSSLRPTYHEELIKDDDGYFQFKTTFYLSLDTVYSAIAGGSMEIRWLEPPVYSHITIAAADTNRTNDLRLGDIPLRVEIFKPNQFMLSSAACYSDSIEKWQYSCFREGVRMHNSSVSTTSGSREELLYMYHHPNLTFEEWLEHVATQPEAADNEPWAILHQTNIDADSICLYSLLPASDARVLASARLVCHQSEADDTYLNEALFYELRREENPGAFADVFSLDKMPYLSATVPVKDTWTELQKYSYACGVVCADWVQRALTTENVNVRYGYAISELRASHYSPDWEAGRAWRAEHGEKEFFFADFKEPMDALFLEDGRRAFFFVAGILFAGVFERPVEEMDSSMVIRALFDHLEDNVLMSRYDDEAMKIWQKYHTEKEKK